MLFTSQKNTKIARNHRAKGVRRSFSIYITQIKPLENGDYDSVPKRPPLTSNNANYKQKNQKIARNYLTKEVLRSFSIYITKIKPLENGDYKSVQKHPIQKMEK